MDETHIKIIMENGWKVFFLASEHVGMAEMLVGMGCHLLPLKKISLLNWLRNKFKRGEIPPNSPIPQFLPKNIHGFL